MKFWLLISLSLFSLGVYAESSCDLRPGTSMGIKVIEFVSGNTIHSKMPFTETTPSSLIEEMLSLQDMGVCEEKITARKCVLKIEKHGKNSFVTFYRGKDRWSSWTLKSKNLAQEFVKHLKRLGFCS